MEEKISRQGEKQVVFLSHFVGREISIFWEMHVCASACASAWNLCPVVHHSLCVENKYHES